MTAETYVDPPTVEQPTGDMKIAEIAKQLRVHGYDTNLYPTGLPTVEASLAVGKRHASVVIVRGAYQLVTEQQGDKAVKEWWPDTVKAAVDRAVDISGSMGWIAPAVEADEQPSVIGDEVLAEGGGVDQAPAVEPEQVDGDTVSPAVGAA